VQEVIVKMKYIVRDLAIVSASHFFFLHLI